MQRKLTISFGFKTQKGHRILDASSEGTQVVTNFKMF